MYILLRYDESGLSHLRQAAFFVGINHKASENCNLEGSHLSTSWLTKNNITKRWKRIK